MRSQTESFERTARVLTQLTAAAMLIAGAGLYVTPTARACPRECQCPYQPRPRVTPYSDDVSIYTRFAVRDAAGVRLFHDESQLEVAATLEPLGERGELSWFTPLLPLLPDATYTFRFDPQPDDTPDDTLDVLNVKFKTRASRELAPAPLATAWTPGSRDESYDGMCADTVRSALVDVAVEDGSQLGRFVAVIARFTPDFQAGPPFSIGTYAEVQGDVVRLPLVATRNVFDCDNEGWVPADVADYAVQLELEIFDRNGFALTGFSGTMDMLPNPLAGYDDCGSPDDVPDADLPDDDAAGDDASTSNDGASDSDMETGVDADPGTGGAAGAGVGPGNADPGRDDDSSDLGRDDPASASDDLDELGDRRGYAGSDAPELVRVPEFTGVESGCTVRTARSPRSGTAIGIWLLSCLLVTRLRRRRRTHT